MKIVKATEKALRVRCEERGYTLEQVMPCVVSKDKPLWEIDVEHPAYPKPTEKSANPIYPQHIAAQFSAGPGTELKALLKDWLGIQASPNCSCNARAKQMDEWGPDLCEQNLPTIVDWLGEQAAARKLPFVRFAAEQAVKLAIRRARKKAAR